MRFLIDAQLPPALARLLESNGHVAEHVADKAVTSTQAQQSSRRSRFLPLDRSQGAFGLVEPQNHYKLT